MTGKEVQMPGGKTGGYRLIIGAVEKAFSDVPVPAEGIPPLLPEGDW
ncbi:hypothetical protein JWG39_04640 [Desulforhopalus vacuolatus]|nr:hypothetical protein [Desulforhopalus vacuolatus]MBM9519104.1 hypothetical protein [Desulforhopalus vacuolatus]